MTSRSGGEALLRRGNISPASSPVSWFRFFAPPVTDLFFTAILFSLSCGAFGMRMLGDGGTGWHIRNGEDILQTHSISRVDLFSSTMSGQTWYAWEWLYDVVIAGIHHWLGLTGVVFFAAVIIAAAFSMALRVGIKRGGGLPVTLILLALSMGAASIHFLARPHVLSWLLAVIWFQLLERDSNALSAAEFHRLLWYPLLMLLWVNVHGGFLLGLILVAVYSAGKALEFLFSGGGIENRGLTRSQLVHLISAGLLSLAASLANPFGYKLYAHIYKYLTNRFLMDHIDEFLSPNFHGAAQQCFALILILTILALATTPKKLPPAILLVVVFAAYSGLYSSRNLPISSILLTLIIAPMFSMAMANGASDLRLNSSLRKLFARLTSFSARVDGMENGFRWHTAAVVALICGIAICMNGGRISGRQLMNAQFGPERFPVQAVNLIAARGIRDPIFCPDYWGGYLIYRLYPKTKVVVDDRHDFYGEEFFREYIRTNHVTPEWKELLDQRGVNWLLVPPKSPLANILKDSPQWVLDHEDGTASLFRRGKKLGADRGQTY